MFLASSFSGSISVEYLRYVSGQPVQQRVV
jgi:hypothetical protein